MARGTLTDLESQVRGLVSSLLDATGITWDDYGRRLDRVDRVPPGEARLQIASMYSTQNFADSNASYASAEVRVGIHYNATTQALHETWQKTHLQNLLTGSGPTHADGLLHRTGWRDLAAVYEVVSGPEAAFPERVGNVVTIEIVAIVDLTPS